MRAVNEPGASSRYLRRKTRRDRATRDPPPSLEVRCLHTPALASNAITPACSAQVRAPKRPEPLAAQVALDAVLVGVVGKLADAPVVEGAVRQPAPKTSSLFAISQDHGCKG
jgi:hypothetical protein